MKLIFAILLLAAIGAAEADAADPAVADPAAETTALQTVVIKSAKGERTFSVEVVKTTEDRNRGLMFRRQMDADRGMLFDYDPPQKVAFWMKNTYLPLDIIFIDVGGYIISIAENTTPLSLDSIPSGGKARGVLEINAGLAKKLGIKVGDRVHHELFEP
jgi:hypothetical protein